jgi:hypothetical protein
MLPKEAGVTTHLPGDNSSFVRSKILKFEDELEILLNSDILLIRRLVAVGEKLYRTADLTLSHWNETGFCDGWIALFYWNQMYICNRLALEKWSFPHRALRFLSTPLSPFVRTIKSYRRARENVSEMKQFLADLPVLFLYHVGSASGLAAGLLFGYQNSEHKFADCETSARRDD